MGMQIDFPLGFADLTTKPLQVSGSLIGEGRPLGRKSPLDGDGHAPLPECPSWMDIGIVWYGFVDMDEDG